MSTLHLLTGALALAALTELVLLRTGSRTLIHIPGLGRFDVSIGILAEAGRLAYYVAAVLLVTSLGYLAVWLLRTSGFRSRAAGVLLALFVIVAAGGRLELITVAAVGWCSMIGVATLAGVAWIGVRSVPLVLFAGSWTVASWSILGQGSGGGLGLASVDTSVILAESLLILAGVTAPLLLRGEVSRPGLLAGFVAFLLVAAGFSLGGSTASILTLWNLGVPGWFSPTAFGLAFAGLITTVWSALAGGERMTAISIALLVAGGVGTISTYQTGLVFAAITVFYCAQLAGDSEASHEPGSDAVSERLNGLPALSSPAAGSRR